ncbi:hypothetical protein GF325_01295 [Candidatus Bathyarchaeota archaeon]|nr:hypothetical protein [Candidatus Bathyarchaeota archaeon]
MEEYTGLRKSIELDRMMDYNGKRLCKPEQERTKFSWNVLSRNASSMNDSLPVLK